jgi:hypothetical protein
VLPNSYFLPYNYVPTEWVCVMFVALFSLSSSKPFDLVPVCNSHENYPVIHVVQAIRFRQWWLFPTAVLCGLLEVLGWSARLWSSKSPFLLEPFYIQCVLW